MARPDPGVLAWASAVLGSEVAVVRSLRLGGSPWLLRGGGRNVVLRVIAAERAGETQTEVAAMTHVAQAAEAGLPVPEVLGYDLAEQTGYALVLTGQVPGSGVIPAEPDPERLRALGAVAARISSVTLSPTRALPVRHRPIEAEDFARLRREQGASALLRAAEAAVARAGAAVTAGARMAGTGAAEAGVAGAGPGDGRVGLVHGDLWYGNTLWNDEGRLTAILDWDCAGVGPAGIDLGALRCDAAWCHGLSAADDILRGWEAEAGRAGCDVAYWDVVAALSSPPDMGWFPESMAAQGRPDLTHTVMLERRDAFLAAALSQLEAAD